LKDKENKEIK